MSQHKLFFIGDIISVLKTCSKFYWASGVNIMARISKSCHLAEPNSRF